MKKTLLALTVAALAAGSAQAYNFHIDETGTDIDFNGSLRLKWESTSNKTNYEDGSVSKDHINSAVSNNGSRFGFKVKQNLGGDFYALGRVEWRFRDAKNLGRQNEFGHVYARQLYAGFGYKHAEKQFSELTYGNMTTITDEVKRTDLPNTYSLSDGLLDNAARRATQYTYTAEYDNGDKVRAGVYYGGFSKRNDINVEYVNDKNATADHRKNVWGVGAIYEHKIDDIQSLSVATGFSRDIFANKANTNTSFAKNAYSLGATYTFVNTTYGLDLERQVTKNEGAYGNKRTKNEVRAVVLQKFNTEWTANKDLNVYAMVAYKTDKRDFVAENDRKATTRQFMVGTEYYVYKEGSIKIKPFLEWQATRTTYDNTSGGKYNKKLDRSRDLKTVVGLRAYW